ncbi:MAG: hypothetical protein GY757_30405, partial [bacterium]|nr:hypothetical protein [bacterium]
MKINCVVCFLSLLVIVAAFGAIVFQLHFWLIPSVCFAVGLVSALWNERFSLFLFLFLFPFINAAPELLNSPYPFNYMAVSLFLLSGICVAMVYRKFRFPESVDASKPYLDGDFVPYYLFLFVLLVSTVFLLLRWTNITLP